MPLPPELYDHDYFLSDLCEGWERFQTDRGLSPLKQRELKLLDVRPGFRVLDAGCGRGEVLLACARAGAVVHGIDYSEAAVELTRGTLADDVPDPDVRQGDVTDLPWPDGSFDRILFGDVIEHLDEGQQRAAIHEFRRVCGPGGLLVIHTAPNRLFLELGWPVARLAMRALGRGEAARGLDEWIAASKRYHVGERSSGDLARLLRRLGFAEVRAWVDPDVLRSGEHHLTKGVGGGLAGLAARVAGLRPLRDVLGNDVYAIAHTS